MYAANGELDPEHAAGQHTLPHQLPRRHAPAAAAEMAQHAVKRPHHQRKAELLGAVPLGKAGRGINHQRQHGQHQPGAAARAVEGHQMKGAGQKQGRKADLHQVHAGKIPKGDQRAQRVQGIEQRALVVIQVAVDHLPPRHALADGTVDVGVGPVVDGVATGGLGTKKQHRRGNQQRIGQDLRILPAAGANGAHTASAPFPAHLFAHSVPYLETGNKPPGQGKSRVRRLQKWNGQGKITAYHSELIGPIGPLLPKGGYA